MRICSSSIHLLRVQIFLQIDPKFFPERFEVTEVFVILTLVFNLGFYAFPKENQYVASEGLIEMRIPSKIRTAVGKSLTLLAALRAAVITDGDGTRS